MAETHARAARAAGSIIAGVAASTPQRSVAAAARLQATRSFDSAAELIASPDIDVVHICTPNSLHVPFALLAIEAAKAVVCEKPLATTFADADLLTERAAQAGVVTAVPFVYRFYPAVRETRARIRAGEGGEMLLLHGSYLQDWLSAPQSTNWRVDAAQGGIYRAFADIGVHWCDLMEFTTGHRISRLTANLSTAFRNRGVGGASAGTSAGTSVGTSVGTEDVATLLFETDRGAAGSLTVSQISQGRKNRLWFSFDGTEASYEFNQESPNTLLIGGVNENRVIVSGSAAMDSVDARRLAFLPAGHPQGYQDAFNQFISDAHQSVRGEFVEGLPTFEDGRRAAQITDAVIASSASQAWVDVPRARQIVDLTPAV